MSQNESSVKPDCVGWLITFTLGGFFSVFLIGIAMMGYGDHFIDREGIFGTAVFWMAAGGLSAAYGYFLKRRSR